jgi:hypothetical protein
MLGHDDKSLTFSTAQGKAAKVKMMTNAYKHKIRPVDSVLDEHTFVGFPQTTNFRGFSQCHNSRREAII